MDKFRAEGKFLDFVDYGKLDSMRGFGGVRIEEDYLVTASGAETLSRDKPRETAEVEVAMRG
jgi:Xaa-Pro aminopeptidase